MLLALLAPLLVVNLPTMPAPVAPVVAHVLWGAPAICFPIDIGDANSLPWGKDGFSLDTRYDRSTLVVDTLAVLDSGEDLLVHMETLRRAVIMTTGITTRYSPSRAVKQRDAKALITALTTRLDRELQHPDNEADPQSLAIGRALFDLGYASAALDQAGAKLGDESWQQRLPKAALMLRDNPAAQLGVVLATCAHRKPSAVMWQHLDKLFKLVEDQNNAWSRSVAKNATSIVAPFLGLETHDSESLAELANKRQRGA